MSISDWSSDVCSSDLMLGHHVAGIGEDLPLAALELPGVGDPGAGGDPGAEIPRADRHGRGDAGRVDMAVGEGARPGLDAEGIEQRMDPADLDRKSVV